MTRASVESVESFRARARRFLDENVPRRAPGTSLFGGQTGEGQHDEKEYVCAARSLQATLFDAGFAGIAYPVEYGGQGLPVEHARAFTEIGAAYELPLLFGVTQGIIGPTLLEFGTTEQKERYIPGMLRGEDLWVQLLSEPSGGSDLAGALTHATRDGSGWVVNGAKTWTTGAHYSDYGFCLARTNFDVPKHSGLSVFIIPLDAPGVTVRPIPQSNGSADFCEEFFDEVRVGPENLIGEVDGGWTVILAHLAFERDASAGGGILGGLGGGLRRGGRVDDLVAVAKANGTASDPRTRDLIADTFVRGVVNGHLIDRVGLGMATGAMPESAAALLKLYWGTRIFERCRAGLAVASGAAVLGNTSDSTVERYGTDFIGARAHTIAGGTDEMQRNTISERLLGLPRERAGGHGLPFREVRTNTLRNRPGDSPATADSEQRDGAT